MNFMDEALKEAYEGIEKKHGGPYTYRILELYVI